MDKLSWGNEPGESATLPRPDGMAGEMPETTGMPADGAGGTLASAAGGRENGGVDAQGADADNAELGPAGDSARFDVLVVCPADWQATLEPWLAYRAAQGYSIGLTDRPHSPQQLKELLQQLHPRGLKFVLLVGDVPALFDFSGTGVPTQTVNSEVSARFGGRARVATDHWYADLDGDQAPELAVGRWSVHSAEQLSAVIEKTIRFETHPDPGFLQRRIEFVAGVGGFGAVEDKVIEGTATRLLAELIPGYHTVGMTHASWRSVYCPGPGQYQAKIFESLNRGALFWVYMGHGSWDCLDAAAFPDQIVPTITTENAQQITSSTSPIALLLACETGQFDLRQDCLAESMARAPHGPVAVIAGTGVTAPFGLANFGLELLVLYREGQAVEVGAWIQQAKRQMVLAARNREATVDPEAIPADTDAAASPDATATLALLDLGQRLGETLPDYRTLLYRLAKLLSPTRDILEQEIYEHAQMMTYFGDPLLRLPQFSKIDLVAQAEDGQWAMAGSLPEPVQEVMEVELEIIHPLDRLGFRPKSRRKYEANDAFARRLEEDYERANSQVIHRASLPVSQGQFYLPLANLGRLPDRFWVRVWAQLGDRKALGFSEVHWDDATSQCVIQAPQTERVDAESQVVSTGADLPAAPVELAGEGSEESWPQEKVIDLFDGQSTAGWKVANFGGEGEVLIEDRALVLEMGQPLTGITWAGSEQLPVAQLPRDNYELRIRAKKIDGGDFFCAVTFPVQSSYCSFVVGGWGGMTVGLSSIDGLDAQRNATRTVHKFEPQRWYDLRVKVSSERIECWIDSQQVVNQPRQDHQFSIRPEVRLSEPLGLTCFQTTAAYEKIQLVILDQK
jgi:hypothetical protein